MRKLRFTVLLRHVAELDHRDLDEPMDKVQRRQSATKALTVVENTRRQSRCPSWGAQCTSCETAAPGAFSAISAGPAPDPSARSPGLRSRGCITRTGSIGLPSVWPAQRRFTRQ